VPKIMFRCPVFGSAVPTGLTTEQIIFDSLPPDLEIPMRCPACMKFHNWEPKDAWVENDARPADDGRRGLSRLR
jgi:hypothetical protein